MKISTRNQKSTEINKIIKITQIFFCCFFFPSVFRSRFSSVFIYFSFSRSMPKVYFQQQQTRDGKKRTKQERCAIKIAQTKYNENLAFSFSLVGDCAQCSVSTEKQQQRKIEKKSQ